MAQSKVRKMKREDTVDDRKRLEKNKKARARHWRDTGVSAKTVEWMEREGFL